MPCQVASGAMRLIWVALTLSDLLRLQGEIFAAEGYGKVTGEVGVCIATSGPGATNLVTGLADALLDSVPMVAITGQVRRSSTLSLSRFCGSITAVIRTARIARAKFGATSATRWPRCLKYHITCHLQVPRRMIGTDAFQETPIVEVTRQITKHNYLVMDVRDLPRIVKEVGIPLC